MSGLSKQRKRFVLLSLLAASVAGLLALISGYEQKKVVSSGWKANDEEGNVLERLVEQQMEQKFSAIEEDLEALVSSLGHDIDSGNYSDQTLEIVESDMITVLAISKLTLDISNNINRPHIISISSEWENAGYFSRAQEEVIDDIFSEYFEDSEDYKLYRHDFKILGSTDHPDQWQSVVSQILYGFEAIQTQGVDAILNNPKSMPIVLVYTPKGGQFGGMITQHQIQGSRRTNVTESDVNHFRGILTREISDSLNYLSDSLDDDEYTESDINTAYESSTIRLMAIQFRDIYGRNISDEQVEIIRLRMDLNMSDEDFEFLIDEIRHGKDTTSYGANNLQ